LGKGPEVVATPGQSPLQSDIDAAYAMRIYLEHHPGRKLSLSTLIWQCGISEQRLKAAFGYQFQEGLEDYREKMQWRRSSR
jgi:AraC-like DNA-binding protein